MAYVWKHPKSSYWTAVFLDETNRLRKKSTKLKVRSKAMAVALEWERAGSLGREHLLTEAACHEVIGGILERTTGDPLKQASASEFCREWLRGKSGTKSDKTSLRYESTVRRFLDWLGVKADRPLKAITPRDCQSFHDFLQEQRLAPASIVVEIKTLRSVFNAAKRMGLIIANPAVAVELPERIRQSHRKVFTPAQVEMLLQEAKGEWQTVILFGYYAGLRLSDAVSLTWENVNLAHGKITLEPKKTGDRLEIPLHPSLEQHLGGMANDTGGPLTPELGAVSTSGRSGLSKQFLAIMRRAGISNQSKEGVGQRSFSQLSFHALRASFNSMLHNSGVSQELRKKLTGHKSDAVNDVYTRTELETLRNAVRTLPGIGAGEDPS